MDELREDKKQIEKEISRVINHLEKKYNIKVSDIKIFNQCHIDKNGNIKDERKVKLVIQI